MRTLSLGLILSGSLFVSPAAAAAPARVALEATAQGHRLTVDGEPFKIRGAGGDEDRGLLKAAGGNAFRTWGVGEDTPEKLDEAETHGLKVVLGIWIEHARHGFDYGDAAAVQKQHDAAIAAVKRFKDHPALLLWAVGNEMEGFDATTDPRVWKAVNAIAAEIHRIDPNHPTLTVIAEIGGDKLASIKRYGSAIDIVGINSYGGVTSIPKRYAAAGLKKPYIVTEFGPPGTWEVGKNAWDVPEELTSTAKGPIYTHAYAGLDADPNCLGSFAFLWGNKQEATATWFGMLLPDGTRLAAVDAMEEAWSGRAPVNRCPRIESLTLSGEPVVAPGATLTLALAADDPEGDPLAVQWVLTQEDDVFETAGDERPAPPTLEGSVVRSDAAGADVKMPDTVGNYRIYAYVRDGAGGGAVANLPLRVEESRAALRGERATLPLVLYGDGANGSAFVPSGFMGRADAIKLNEASRERPYAGSTSLEVKYTEPGEWGGVVWQAPANDWGDQPGGVDLTGAGALEFYVRGAAGGEVVKFGFGLIGREKPFYDTGKAEKEVRLTTDWQKVSIPLAGLNLAHIKSGFFWSLAGNGGPQAFYLDDVRFTAETGNDGPAPTAVAPASGVPLPFVVVGDGMVGDPPYVPSGYMGSHAAIKMNETSADRPHSGATCTQATFSATSGWGGVVWQSPANNWGAVDGGHDLTGATALEFWARGAAGGEKVKFGLGIIKNDQPFFDSVSMEREFTLTADWQLLRFELAGQDLSAVRTGFYWTLASPGKPVSFFIDDVAYVGDVAEPE